MQFYLIAPLIALIYKFSSASRRFFLLSAALFLQPLLESIPHKDFTVLDHAQYFLVGFLLADFHVVHPPSGDSAELRRLADISGIVGLLGMALLPERNPITR